MAKIKPFRSRGKKTISKSNASTNPDRLQVMAKGGQNMRSQSTIKRLNMYKGGKPIRNRKGQVIKAAEFQSEVASGVQARVEPNRRWFGNTRVISQNSLQKFQTEIGKVIKDPYQMILKPSKLPMSLLHDRAKTSRVHILDTESFESTFGKKSKRKRPNIAVADLSELNAKIATSTEAYDADKDEDLVRDSDGTHEIAAAFYNNAGQSRRIWNELYKVLDCSDVVIEVLDARDPMGTRCGRVEKYLTQEKPHKHLIFVLNKVDLVPTWVTKAWVATLSSEHPTVAFHASITNPFGKGALINLLRQFGKLHSEKKNISCGFIGYPNVGKSSIINTLRKKKVCKVAPLAGETKVWQYITLMKRIFLVDCPGIVQPSGDTETEIILKGVVRVEYVQEPDQHIAEILRRVKPEYMARQYQVTDWKDSEDFLTQMANRMGKLLKGGLPDWKTVSKMILNDWQRGRIPYYVRPPGMKETTESEANTAATETTNEVETTDKTDTDKPATAVDLEKQLEPVEQDLAQVKVGLEFTDELDNSEKVDSKPDEEISADKSETPDQIECLEEDVVLPSRSETPSKAPTKLNQADTKLKKLRKFLSTSQQRRFDTVTNFTDSMNREDLPLTARRKKRKAAKGNKSEDAKTKDEFAVKTSKQKRAEQRQTKKKKVGSDYYSSANVKNKNRRKT
uniref:Nucleolar GTP-binding protein 2 n=1 Tax=Phallusia mammillata TaxID=59560 RepID=A0A6F9DDR4_9ASCI|nr:nucleolar GTP-binding protein 2-like [Phallusia mammillata]